MDNIVEPINKDILDDLTLRFVINNNEFLQLHPEEYFFILEEAYWFALDLYKIKYISLLDFTKQILNHNAISLDHSKDYMKFKSYKQSIKVFGTMLFSSDFTHVLLVQQAGNSNTITFPKGKKSKNETGMECAIRETIEEVGYDATNKIIDISVTVFDKITFYLVMNVDMNYKFKTNTRNEISKIFWFDLRKFNSIRNKKEYKIFATAYSQVEKLIERIKKTCFKFDLSKIETAIDSVL